MTIQIGPLPAYQASAGPNSAKQVEAARARYRAQVAALRDELRATEEAFASGFTALDAQATARDRITDLAKKNRRIV